MVLTVSFVLSLAIGLFCHHRRQYAQGTFADLTPASRRQDHTTSPSAAVSTKAARQAWYQSRRSFSEGGSSAARLATPRVHRIPPRVRDDREPPLLSRRDNPTQ